MAPTPVTALLTPVISMELTIISVPLAQVYAVGTVFAVIPLMVVTMIAIVVASMLAASSDNHFLRSARLGGCRGSESRSEKNKSQIFCC
jgi:hypothetical protein